MPTSTTNYGLSKPLVNDPTDQDLWGGELNGDMDELDGLMATAIKWPKSAQTADFSVTAPTTGSATTGSSKKFFLCDATSAAIAVTLPAAASAGDGFPIAFKKTDASGNAITLNPNGSEQIDGAASYVLSAQYSFVVLVCDGTGWNIQSQSTVATVSVKSVKTQTFTSTGTYTPSSGMLYAIFRLIGGGGGGGYSNGGPASGGGGGGYTEATLTAVQIGASKAVTIGAAGTGGTGTGNGGTGGDTSVGTLAIAKGGSGGVDTTAVGTIGAPGGVATGIGTAADFGIPGARGSNGQSGIGTADISGNGANSQFGQGGAGVILGDNLVGGSASGYGAGGGGAGGSNKNGGAGAPGFIVVTEYLSV